MKYRSLIRSGFGNARSSSYSCNKQGGNSANRLQDLNDLVQCTAIGVRLIISPINYEIQSNY